MSECDRTGQIGAYHDGELPAGPRAEVEKHLADCAPCRAELTAFREMSRLVSGLADPPVPNGLMRCLHRMADAAGGAWVRRLAAAVTALAAAVLIVCSAWVWHLASASPRDEEPPRWEQTAARRSDYVAPETPEDQLATWMVENLSTGDHD